MSPTSRATWLIPTSAGSGHRPDIIAEAGGRATIDAMTDTATPLNEQLEEIGAQLDWVRDYL